MKNICPKCLTKLDEMEMSKKQCHCGYNFVTNDELFTIEEAKIVHDRINKEKEKSDFLEMIGNIQKDIHFIAQFIKVCITIMVIIFIFTIVLPLMVRLGM